jgi:hypothetical protein
MSKSKDSIPLSAGINNANLAAAFLSVTIVPSKSNTLLSTQIKCAEVLVLNHVPIEYLIKIKVATKAAYDEVCNYILNVPVEIDRDIFFM